MTGKRALYRRKPCTETPCSVLYLVGIYNWYYRIDCDRAEGESSAVAEGILDRIINNKYSIEVKGRISMRKRHAFSNEESGVNNNG